jgi:hypothetical protein
MSREDKLFGAIYRATDNPDWAVSDVADAVRTALLSDATVERAADILLQGDMGMCECRRSLAELLRARAVTERGGE